ncbi:MAG: TetR/AcrR family transcriptional regulator [Deltaproteobacteria bacterium]|nr:TetR/AcrR family transcriptional regulator [Deltaproteobacteria bacterium]MBW2361844.1 TetR/AcrR family transcriptional regulator [Deltaproteobacteria bacterium]
MAAKSSRTRRKYDTSLRREQAAQTRERIVEAIIEQLSDASLGEFSVSRVARLAGVSEPTVYRNFPNYDAMMDGVREYWAERFKAPPPPTRSRDLGTHAARNFAFFDENAAISRAFYEARLSHSYRMHRHKDRKQGFRKALADVTDHLEPDEIRRAEEVIQLLDSSFGWMNLADVGLEGDEAGKAVAWAIDTLVRELARMNRRASKGGGK